MKRPPPSDPRTYGNAVLLFMLTGLILGLILLALVVSVVGHGWIFIPILLVIYWFGYRDYPYRMHEAWQWIKFYRYVGRNQGT